MGWFSEQLKCRIKADRNSFEDAFIDLSSVVLGKSSMALALNNDREKTQNATEEILRYYKAKIIELPNKVEDMNEQLEYMLRPTGLMRRTVKLKGKWWKDAIGPMLAETVAGDTVALLPDLVSGYKFFDYQTGNEIRLSSKTKNMIKDEAICFYKPFSLKKLKIVDLIKFIMGSLNVVDFIMIIAITLVVQGIGLIAAPVNKLLIGKILPSGQTGLLIPVSYLLIGMVFSTTLISITNSLISARIDTKLRLSVECASMSRILSLPANFFKEYNSGELANRVGYVQALCGMLTDIFLKTGLTTLFSFMYIFQMNMYAPQLVIPGILVVVVQVVVMIFHTLLLLKLQRKQMKVGAKLGGVVYALFSSIQKIKLSGAERRAFAKWSAQYKKSAELSYNPPILIKVMPIFSTIITLIGTMIIFYIAGSTGVTQENYIPFNTAYGAVSAGIIALAGLSTKFSEIKPILEMVEPILNAEPEISENREILTKLSGSIEINNISFRYDENSPLILDDLSLKIAPGQYVAIVGKTGCGKSTLMRLLLGFEKPQSGAIYYDGKDINRLDLKSLRQHIGAVMQNGKLFQGDIYSNIVISAPWLLIDDAWEAARLASVANDIENMPMGMHTVISEGSGGVSGGQKQRLMIARAIAPRPSILMFDEATSALDNITQKQISQSLDLLKSTRIVIAHRLSTIKNCDRIIVLDNGKIIEDGKYSELINNNCYFAELVKRQQLNIAT